MLTGTGYLHNITHAEKEVLLKIKGYLKNKHNIDGGIRWNDFNILRFCRARKFEVNKIVKMIDEFIIWFENNKYNSIGEVDMKKYDNLKIWAENGYHFTDKHGRPVYIDLIDSLRTKEIFENYTDPSLTLYYVQSYERLVNIILPECSRLMNKRIEQTLTIVDLGSVNIFKLFVGKVKAFVNIASEIGQNYYPELLGSMYIVNAGMLFSGIWMLIKQGLDTKTQNKINIVSGNGRKELQKVIDLDNLPKHFGGTSENKINENHGPWKNELEKSYKDKTIFHHDQSIYQKYYPNLD